MSLIISPTARAADLVDTISKNVNSAASQRMRCPCGRFLGVLAGFKPLTGQWKGARIVICEEIKKHIVSVQDTVEFLRRVGRDPNSAELKGCGRIIVFGATGQVIRMTVPGTEEHGTLHAALEKIKRKQEDEARLQAYRVKQEEALRKWERGGR
jgi:hypothetical protein